MLVCASTTYLGQRSRCLAELHCQHKVSSGQGVLETDPKEQATIFAALSEMKVKPHYLCLVLFVVFKMTCDVNAQG